MTAKSVLPPILLTGVLLASPAMGAGATLRVQPERIEQHIMQLSAFGKNPEGGVSRVAFSQADLDGRKFIGGLMAQAGLRVTVDAAGNLIGFREGSENLPPIMLGSHIDSVPGGGNYDGDVGVIGAIEAARVLHDGRSDRIGRGFDRICLGTPGYYERKLSGFSRFFDREEGKTRGDLDIHLLAGGPTAA